MPPKQRTRAELRSRQKNEGSSSNEDMMDSCSAHEIVARLASKYLLKSSTDTENEKENSKKKQKVFDPYDADLEYSTTDMESQNSACDMETNAEMKKNKKGQKKPGQRKNTKMKQNIQSKTTKTIQSGFTKNRGKTQRKKLLGQSTGSNTESNTQSDASNPTSTESKMEPKTYKKSKKHPDTISMECEGLSLITSQSPASDSNPIAREVKKESKTDKRSKKHSDTISMECEGLSLINSQSPASDSNPIAREVEKKSKTDKKSWKESVPFSEMMMLAMEGDRLSAGSQLEDSGFFVTPPAKGAPFSFLPQLPASDTSTPASAKSSKSQLDDSCFGFENIISPPEPFLISPVNRVSPASSSFGSRDPSFQRSSMDVSSISSRSAAGRSKKKRPLDNDTNRLNDNSSYQAKKVKKPKAKPPKKDFGKWEAMMSAEFEDVEMHELTIES